MCVAFYKWVGKQTIWKEYLYIQVDFLAKEEFFLSASATGWLNLPPLYLRPQPFSTLVNMQTFSKLLAFAALSQVVISARLDLSKRETPLEVTLTEVEGGVVKATVTNVGSEDLKLLTYGSILGM